MLPTRKHCVLAVMLALLAAGGWGAYTSTAQETLALPIPVHIPGPPAVFAATTTQAGLFFTSQSPENFYQAPMLKTDVKLAVSGTMIRATVRQHFYNPSSQWLEGMYVFPLPEQSGVDRLRMQIGDRFVEGRIQETSEAKQTYEQAKQEGKRASLVSSARDNIFSTRVANVGPEEEIIIEIQYTDTVRYADHRYSLRFPMVVAPRYVHGTLVITQEGKVGATEIPDPSEILGPIHDPQQEPINPVILTVILDPGFDTDVIQSRSHPIIVRTGSGNQRVITLADNAVPADRDFVLEWYPPADGGPTTHLIAEQVGADTYLYGTVFPPGPAYTITSSRPRNLTMVLDVSGSMAGTSLTQIKHALDTVFARLNSEDRFNLITFASTSTQLFSEARAATESNIDTARRFVAQLEANGGTEFLPALKVALSGNGDDLRFQQVVVLTDGAIGYEREVLTTIQQHLGARRLFMVGIGSAPNSFVMREAAMLGRGTFTYIGDVNEANERMLALLKKLKHPAVTDLDIAWPPHLIADEPSRQPEQYPSRIPDLYHGDPVTFHVKFRNLEAVHLAGSLRLTGQLGRMLWEQEIPLQHIHMAPGVAKRWAREKIGRLTSEGRLGKLLPDKTKDEIISVALVHQLVTTYTSLVAVDQVEARQPETQLITHRLKTNLPAGWEFESVRNQGAMPRWLVQHQGGIPDRIMPLVPAPTLVAMALPQTATPAQFHLILGFMGLCLFCAAYYLRRQCEKRQDAMD